MQQIHLFEPTLDQRIEELINEPIEKFFVTNKFNLPNDQLFYYCKVLTSKNVYDVSISESYDYTSVINDKANRKLFHKNFL